MQGKPKGHSQYKKLRREGGSTVMAVTGLVPKDWTMVQVLAMTVNYENGDETVIIRLKKVA